MDERAVNFDVHTGHAPVDVEDYDLKGNDFMGPCAASRIVSGNDGDRNAPRRPVRRLPR